VLQGPGDQAASRPETGQQAAGCAKPRRASGEKAGPPASCPTGPRPPVRRPRCSPAAARPPAGSAARSPAGACRRRPRRAADLRRGAAQLLRRPGSSWLVAGTPAARRPKAPQGAPRRPKAPQSRSHPLQRGQRRPAPAPPARPGTLHARGRPRLSAACSAGSTPRRAAAWPAASHGSPAACPAQHSSAQPSSAQRPPAADSASSSSASASLGSIPAARERESVGAPTGAVIADRGLGWLREGGRGGVRARARSPAPPSRTCALLRQLHQLRHRLLHGHLRRRAARVAAGTRRAAGRQRQRRGGAPSRRIGWPGTRPPPRGRHPCGPSWRSA
jgi:hypothetical protein